MNMTAEKVSQANTEGPAQAGSSVSLAGESGKGDLRFRRIAACFAALVPLLALAILFILVKASMVCFQGMGWHFLVSQDWDPIKENFGAAAYIYGTLVSSFLALLIAGPLGVAIALAITEFSPLRIRGTAALVVELLAAVPSVIFGLWGMYVLAPLMRVHVEPILVAVFGHIPGIGALFVGPGTGLSLFSAGVVVAIMILPTVMAICREVFDSIPVALRESALALGSTRWEATSLAVLAPSRTGVIGALILGMGRALGETMAVTMIIGNRALITPNLLAPSDSLASAIANQFTEATSEMHLSALAELGFVLFLITMVLNLFARFLVWATSREAGAAAKAKAK
jgi:phosphate transport system permease protein